MRALLVLGCSAALAGCDVGPSHAMYVAYEYGYSLVTLGDQDDAKCPAGFSGIDFSGLGSGSYVNGVVCSKFGSQSFIRTLGAGQ